MSAKMGVTGKTGAWRGQTGTVLYNDTLPTWPT